MLARATLRFVPLSGTWGNNSLAVVPSRSMSFHLDPDYFKITENKAKPILLGKNNPDSVFFEGPERDLVNFPRRKRPIENPPVRLKFIPEEFFQFFYPKTGVTGPYMFMIGVGTFITSKEIWVLEHEFYTAIATLFAWGFIAKLTGNDVRDYVQKGIDDEEKQLKAIRTDEINACKDAIAEENKAQWMATSWETLIQAKKDNVALQLESAYRERLQEVYSQVKKRLDFQAETTNVLRRTEQKHMVDWIINSVRKSITPKLEEDALKKCVSDLKSMAAAAR